MKKDEEELNESIQILRELQDHKHQPPTFKVKEDKLEEILYNTDDIPLWIAIREEQKGYQFEDREYDALMEEEEEDLNTFINMDDDFFKVLYMKQQLNYDTNRPNHEKMEDYYVNSGTRILEGGGKHNSVGALMQILFEYYPLAQFLIGNDVKGEFS